MARHSKSGETSPAKGRGAGINIQGRFEAMSRQPEDDGWDLPEEDAPAPLTQVMEWQAKSAIARNDSPDVPFSQSVNPYQGCEHGCIYCYARPSHAYFNLSPGLDFETRLLAKTHAPQLLRRELARPGYRCEVLALGANTDPYQPIERQRRITRGILEVLAECRHPVSIVTKSALVEKDLDLLVPMAEQGLARVALSVTTLDAELARRMEPRCPSPQRRLQAIARLAGAGVPVGVLAAPVIPFLTDPELEAILKAARQAGAGFAGFVLLRLPHEVNLLFQDWLERHYPLKAAHVMSRLRQMRQGRDNDPAFGRRMTGSGEWARLLARRFDAARRRLGFAEKVAPLDRSRFKPPALDHQLALF